jgi:hypothetical protein
VLGVVHLGDFERSKTAALWINPGMVAAAQCNGLLFFAFQVPILDACGSSRSVLCFACPAGKVEVGPQDADSQLAAIWSGFNSACSVWAFPEK